LLVIWYFSDQLFGKSFFWILVKTVNFYKHIKAQDEQDLSKMNYQISLSSILRILRMSVESMPPSCSRSSSPIHSQSYKDTQLISEAIMEAESSPVLMRHGCVATKNGKIIARG